MLRSTGESISRYFMEGIRGGQSLVKVGAKHKCQG